MTLEEVFDPIREGIPFGYLPFRNIRNPESGATRTYQQVEDTIDSRGKVLISAADTTAGYLYPSLAFSNGITGAILNPAADETLSIAGIDATTAVKGVASFTSGNFSVAAGAVSIKALGVSAAHLNTGTGAGQIYAATIPTDTTGFTGNLSAADTTVQKALDTIDNLSISAATHILNADYTFAASYDLAETDTKNVVFIDSTLWPIAINLKAVNLYGDGRHCYFKRLNAAGNAITIASTVLQTIDGAASYSLTNQYDTVHLVARSGAWYIVSKYP